MIAVNHLKQKLDAGKAVMGTWSVIPSPVVADIIGSVGLDFLIIDAEHGPASYETAQEIAIACEARSVSPVMRVGGVNPGEILRALETGVHCIQIPNVATVEDVSQIVSCVNYPPAGNRGFSPFTRAGGYSHRMGGSVLDDANVSTLLAIHVEGKCALDNLEAMCRTPELDIVFIGMYDLSQSLGIPGDVENPRVMDAARSMASQITSAGKYAGTIVTNADQLAEFLDMGVKYITYSVDCEMLKRSYQEALECFGELTRP